MSTKNNRCKRLAETAVESSRGVTFPNPGESPGKRVKVLGGKDPAACARQRRPFLVYLKSTFRTWGDRMEKGWVVHKDIEPNSKGDHWEEFSSKKKKMVRGSQEKAFDASFQGGSPLSRKPCERIERGGGRPLEREGKD